MDDSLPLVLVPAGDPAGIGPEIAVKAYMWEEVRNSARVAVIADSRVIQRILDITRLPLIIKSIIDPQDGVYEKGTLNIIDIPNASPDTFSFGKTSAICGAAAVLGAESVIRPQPYKTAVAVSTVVIFGTIAMFLYPVIYNTGISGLDAREMGVYTGSTLHEVAHVVGAGNAMGRGSIWRVRYGYQ